MRSLKSFVNLLPPRWQGRLRRHYYARKLAAARVDDETDLQAALLFSPSGGVVFDVGANFGLYTRFLSEAVGAAGRVYAFEPTPPMFEVLRNNAARLLNRNVRCQNLALSDHEGTMSMQVPRSEDGSWNFYEASLSNHTEPGGSSDWEVGVTRLDDFCQKEEVERIDFIKCDVEGHELEVLSGATTVLRRFSPVILLEVNDSLTHSLHGKKVCALVESLGYAIHTFSEGRVKPWNEIDQPVNYLLIPAVKANLRRGAAVNLQRLHDLQSR